MTRHCCLARDRRDPDLSSRRILSRSKWSLKQYGLENECCSSWMTGICVELRVRQTFLHWAPRVDVHSTLSKSGQQYGLLFTTKSGS
jgi:hypothetical protein